MQAYSLDLRARVLTDCDRGLTTRAVATKFSVSESWVRRLKQRRRDTGEVAPRRPRPRQLTLAPHLDRIRELVATHPDATLQELRSLLGVAVCVATLWAAVRRLGLTVKKKCSGRPSRTGRTCSRSGTVGGPPSRPSTRRG